jgi:hypothetical protein
VLRSPRVQKQNSCCNWDGRASFLEQLHCPYRRLCGPVFEGYYDQRARANAVLLSAAAAASLVSVVLAGALYAQHAPEAQP